jgi:membrane-associated phospholipid phosphatase
MPHLSPEIKQAFVLATVLYGFYLMLNSFFETSLFNWSLPFIVGMQEEEGGTWIHDFFQGGAQLGNPLVVAGALAVYLVLSPDKFNGFKLVFFISCASYIMSIMKAIYQAPRPYFIDPKILPLQTYAEYGNPSGHAFMCVFGYGYVFYCYHIYRSRQKVIQQAAQQHLLSFNRSLSDAMDGNMSDSIDIAPPDIIASPSTKKKKKNLDRVLDILQFVVIFILISICFGRVYLGMHTINQVLLGLVSGGYWLYVLVQYYDAAVTELFTRLVHKTFPNKIVAFFSLLVGYVFFSTLPLVLYQLNSNNSSGTSDVWTIWYPQVCTDFQLLGDSPCDESNFAYYKVILDCSLIGCPFGILFGLFISNGNYDRFAEFPKPTWKQLGLRTLVYVALGGIFFTIYLVVPKSSSYPLRYLFNNNIPLFFAMIIMIRMVPYLYQKLNLDLKGDFLQLRSKTGERDAREESNENLSSHGVNSVIVIRHNTLG